MIWPSAAAGINTSPRGKQDTSNYTKMQYKISEAN